MRNLFLLLTLLMAGLIGGCSTTIQVTGGVDTPEFMAVRASSFEGPNMTSLWVRQPGDDWREIGTASGSGIGPSVVTAGGAAAAAHLTRPDEYNSAYSVDQTGGGASAGSTSDASGGDGGSASQTQGQGQLQGQQQGQSSTNVNSNSNRNFNSNRNSNSNKNKNLGPKRRHRPRRRPNCD